MKDFTSTQEKQYNYLCKRESRETLSMAGSRSLHCTCKECGPNGERVCCGADSAKTWLKQHAGHKTWIQEVK